MKIMRTTPNFPPVVNGPANTAYELTTRLEDRGVSNQVLTTIPMDGGESNVSTAELDVTRIKPVFSPFQYDISPAIPAVLLRKDFDVIHAHSYRNAFTDSSYVISKISGCPFVLQTHGTLIGYQQVRSKPSFAHRAHDRLSLKRVAKDADAVIVSSKQERAEAIQYGINSNNVNLITEGKDVEYYSSIPKRSPDEEFRMLFVGRIAPSRNVSTLIKSLKHLAEDIRLRIVGHSVDLSGSSQKNSVSKLKRLAEHLNVSHRVDFVGPKYNSELIREYRNADLFVYVSSYENFSQPVAEAALAGLPVIATPIGIAPEIIQEGKTGCLVSFNDVPATAAAIADIRGKNTNKLGLNMQQVATERFKWSRIIDQIEDLYEQVIDKYNN